MNPTLNDNSGNNDIITPFETITFSSKDTYTNIDLNAFPDMIKKHNTEYSSPISNVLNTLKAGDTLVDLGCKAGLNIFIASKLVGEAGKVIGIDVDETLIATAERHKAVLPNSSNTIFYQSPYKKLPLEDQSVDFIISNSSINISDNKKAVLEEIYRILNPGGRFLISGIFAIQDIPEYMKHDLLLLDKHIGNAMVFKDFLELMRTIGFCGVSQTNKNETYQIEGIDVIALTITGFKPIAKGTTEQCYATLIGPPSKVIVESGIAFERNQPTPIDSSLADILQSSEYSDYFIISKTEKKLPVGAFMKVLPKPGPCYFKGHYATLIGPFIQIEDDDKHIYYSGVPKEICLKTNKVLEHPQYQRLFNIVNHAGNRIVNGKESDCNTESCC